MYTARKRQIGWGTDMTMRRAIYLQGLHHTNPIPVACTLGNLMVSGSIPGRDPQTGEPGADLATQCALMFRNVERVMTAAGGTTANIIKLTVWLRDVNQKGPLNAEWTRMFPEAASRPARHTFSDPQMAHGLLVQCEITAVLD